MEESTVIAIVAVILSGIGITVGFVYNARSIQQNTKTRYYQIAKDLLAKFHHIDDISYSDPNGYFSATNNFTMFMVTLVAKGIVPKNYILPVFQDTFAESLWIINHTAIPKKMMISVSKFCADNNIQERKLFSERLKNADYDD